MLCTWAVQEAGPRARRAKVHLPLLSGQDLGVRRQAARNAGNHLVCASEQADDCTWRAWHRENDNFEEHRLPLVRTKDFPRWDYVLHAPR